MADVKWIKITTDIFDDEKILMIESLPSSDSIIVIWFKLLTFAGKQNNDGVFMMSNRIAYTDEMLASIFRREIGTVRLALKTFEQFGMIEIVDNVITIPNWNKHQTLDAYEKKKARDRLYQQERRAVQKALISGNVKKSSDKSSDVAFSDKEKEEEIEKDKEKIDLSINLPTEEKPMDRLIDSATISDIKERISYTGLTDRFDTDLLDTVVSCIADLYTATTAQEFNGRTYSAEFVQSRSLEINSMHIEYVLECFEDQREKVRNIRKYLKTAIFNSPDTIGAFYTNKVRADGVVW